MTVHRTPATRAANADPRRIRRFARHYLEMVIAMFAGMFVLGSAAARVHLQDRDCLGCTFQRHH